MAKKILVTCDFCGELARCDASEDPTVQLNLVVSAKSKQLAIHRRPPMPVVGDATGIFPSDVCVTCLNKALRALGLELCDGNERGFPPSLYLRRSDSR
jgi:hypothetical protein